MRRDDLERLHQPYSHPEVGEGPSFAAALGVSVPTVNALAAEIAGDLDPARLGVGWWAPHPGTSRRILISDQLFLCVATIETNLIEAKLHLMEALDAGDREEARLRAAVSVRGTDVRLKLPQSSSPADDLPGVLRVLHTVGVARSLASALDCIGAAIIGVLALPTPILTADMNRALTALDKLKNPTSLQLNARTKISDVFASAGPEGWQEWVDDYRNMLVHRGRRLHSAQLVSKGVGIYMPSGEMLAPPSLVPLLPNAPGRSEVQAFRDGGKEHFLLTENGWNTLHSAVASTLFVAERAAGVLLGAWRERRQQPDMLHQPVEQWRDVAGKQSTFAGYEPGTVPFEPSQMTANPTFVDRLRAAALDDKSRPMWATFD